jgi:hypothetical protein
VPAGRSRRLVTTAVLAGCAVLLAAGCGTKSASTGGVSQTPRQAVAAAAINSTRINSAIANMTEVVGSPARETISGSVQEQLRPSLLLGMNIKVATGGVNLAVGGIITGKAIYLKISALARQLGKPWLEVPFSALGNGSSSLAQLFKSLSKINPAQQTALFAGAKDVRKVGTQVIDGASTTQYTGSIVPSAALGALPAGLRKALAPAMKTISGSIRFNVWIDAQGHIRKQVLHETVNGLTVVTSVTFSAINQTVHVALPPASQVTTVPASALRGTAA